MPSWFRYLFLFDKIITLGGLAGIIVTSTNFLKQKINSSKAIIIGIMIIWLICWFFVAPDPRFVYGVLLFGIFLLLYHIISFVNRSGVIVFLLAALKILVVVGLSYYLVSKPWKQKEYRNWLAPLELPQPPVEVVVIDEIKFRIPEPINNNWNARCYGTDLPCLYIIDQRLKARGKIFVVVFA